MLSAAGREDEASAVETRIKGLGAER